MPPPGFRHGDVQANVFYLLKHHAKTNGLGRVTVESGVVEEAASAEWNLCNKSAPAAELDKCVADFVADLADKSPFCMKITKNTLNRGLDADQESLIVMERMACNVVHHSNDAKEGVAAFLEKRDPVWIGS